MPDDRAIDIGDLLAGRPSRFAFRILCAILDASPPSTVRDAAIRKARAVLTRWPARTRHVSASGSQQMATLLESPTWPLVRSLAWAPVSSDDEPHLGWTTTKFVSDTNARRLCRLELDVPDDAVLPQLHLATSFPRVRHLSINLACDNRRRSVIPLLTSDLPPNLRHLTIDGVECLDDGTSPEAFDVVDAIAASPVAKDLRSVRIRDMPEATLAHFLERFRRPLADIGHQLWTVESLERLCRSRELTSGLKRLSFAGCDLGLEGISLLAQCPSFSRLERLDLTDNAIGPDATAFLSKASFIPDIRRLNLAGNPLGDEGWAILGEARFRRLRALDVSWNGEVTAIGTRSIAKAESLEGLASLMLGGNRFGDEGAVEILNAPFVANLQALGITSTDKSSLTAAGIAAKPFPRLRMLSIGHDPGGPDFGRFLADSVMPTLTYLDIRSLDLGDDGMAHMAKATGFPRLQRLSIAGNSITDQGVRSIAASPLMTPIRQLSIQANPKLNGSGIIALIESPFSKRLVKLDCDEHMLTKDSLQAIESSNIII